MEGEISYVPAEGQAIAATRDWYFDVLCRRRTLLKMIGLWLLMGAAFIPLLWTPEDGPQAVATTFAAGAVAAFAVTCVVWGLSYLLLRPRARRLFRQVKARQGVHTWRWSPDGFALTTPNGSVRYAWRELHGFAEGRNAFLLYFHERHYLALPRDVLTPAQQESFAAAYRAGSGTPA